MIFIRFINCQLYVIASNCTYMLHAIGLVRCLSNKYMCSFLALEHIHINGSLTFSSICLAIIASHSVVYW